MLVIERKSSGIGKKYPLHNLFELQFLRGVVASQNSAHAKLETGDRKLETGNLKFFPAVQYPDSNIQFCVVVVLSREDYAEEMLDLLAH